MGQLSALGVKRTST